MNPTASATKSQFSIPNFPAMKTKLAAFLATLLAAAAPASAPAAAPALVVSADDPPARIAMFSRQDDLAGARFYFDDRNYGPRAGGDYPAWLESRLFFESSAARALTYRCLREGAVTALAPVNKKRDFTESMAALGFAPLPQKTFPLFKNNTGQFVEADIYGGFSKILREGETLTLPPWVILAGFDAPRHAPAAGGTGELLYNGIRLPAEWPPKYDWSRDVPPPVPWLEKRPDVVPVDIGRQLFVDDFLIEKTDLAREFHYPEKFVGNPVLKAKTALEHGLRASAEKPFAAHPGAAPKSGGLWWNTEKQLFELWYEAGWIGTVAYATSRDGLRWKRPSLPRRHGTNQVIHDNIRADSWTVVRDDACPDPQKRFKLFLNGPGSLYRFRSLWSTSPDGINWGPVHEGGISGDRSTAFYNPFRKKWVFSLRWVSPGGRSRAYVESDDFERGMNWLPTDPAPWARADQLDPPDPRVGDKTQLYNLDAVAYESLILGFFQILFGPDNKICAERGTPKFTGLNFAYSRDGFHWHRPDRTIAINSEHTPGKWDRGYIQSLGNICVIRGDKLWFYYIGYAGDATNRSPDQMRSGMYANGATGVATLRRDGFASMNAGAAGGELLTRPLKFSGSRLFINAVASGTAPRGTLRAEICDETGGAIDPFTLANCVPFTGDSTLAPIAWKTNNNGQPTADLSTLAGRPVRIRFALANGKLYSFWVSRDATGRSDGYVAGGGPGYTGLLDTVGRAALEAEARHSAKQ
jgi:hypothetical protein